MALAEMCKGRMAVHKAIADDLAKDLQCLGCCEFVKSERDGENVALPELYGELRRIDELIADAKFVQRVLEPYETKKDGAMARMLGDLPSLSLKDLADKADESKFESFAADIKSIEHKLSEVHSEISRLNGLNAQLALFEKITCPLEFFTTGTDMLIGAVYSVPVAQADGFAAAIGEKFNDLAEIQRIPIKEKETVQTIAVICRKSDLEDLHLIASDHSCARIEVPKDFALQADEEKARIKSETDALIARKDELTRELTALADEGLAMSRVCGDYWSIIKDRLTAMETGAPTEQTLIWEFWTPKSCWGAVKEAAGKYAEFTDLAEVEAEENETPPTLLKNPSWSSCVEPLTVMYGTPTYDRTDPTTLMAPFFFLFLGMCFGDAGYGLLVGGLLMYILVRHQLTPTLRKFFVLMTIGMGVTVVFGALTGSWFGDAVFSFGFMSGVKPLATAMQKLDPMNDPMTLLAISLALGFVQVIFGLVISFHENWKSGDKVTAISDQGGWILFLIGLVMVGLSAAGYLPCALSLVSKGIALAGCLILLAMAGREKTNIFSRLLSGVLSIYGVTSYLGDVLSYSRILALGLGSAAVGMVINLLANLVSETPYVGLILAALIFILGHLFSIAVNLLGAFIHALRLQYVEFFGKFYDATGHDFTPLRNTAQYSNIK
ncbi:MAG: V-type ATP synthase subunit I [Synergistes sp.]|nr:V-type ATP synthase subunit I [Synergistes sp.]